MSATPKPLYDPTTANPAYYLRYTWTGWPSHLRFEYTPSDLLPSIAGAWELDGLRLLEPRWTSDCVQLSFSATPSVSPLLLATRVKGRLDHALRACGYDMPLSRKLAVRAVGDNNRAEVENYIAAQVSNERFADAVFAEELSQLDWYDPSVDLSQPTASARGRYWYNLHVVLVVVQRHRLRDLALLQRIRDVTLQIAAKKEYSVSRLSVMPDHLHVALRPDVSHSPNDVVFALQNNLAFALGQQRLWCENFYVGTFGEYRFSAIRRAAREA